MDHKLGMVQQYWNPYLVLCYNLESPTGAYWKKQSDSLPLQWHSKRNHDLPACSPVGLGRW